MLVTTPNKGKGLLKMKNINAELLKKHLSFLLSEFDFRLKEIKSYDYALYAKFLSNSVGVYFIYEFRDSIPEVQFTLLVEAKELVARPGLYTIRELYKDEYFRLESFYLNEIIPFRNDGRYQDYFKDVKTMDAALKISAEVVKKYADDFVTGNVDIYTLNPVNSPSH